jgi:transcriptional regulator GlxA family with amidase domain
MPRPLQQGHAVLPEHTLDDHPPLDVLLVPGGNGTRREVSNPAITGWIGKTSEAAAWTASVCTGALLLHAAGPARGRRVAATHHAFEDTLQARADITVVRDARYVVDGNLVTTQGVSAGIDMAL